MLEFAIGTILENRPGTLANLTHGAGGGVADRDLVIGWRDSTRQSVWDNGYATADPLSTDMLIGLHYRLLICSLPDDPVTVLPMPPSEPTLGQGDVLDPSWLATPGDFDCAIAALSTQAWVVVTAPMGAIVLPTKLVTVPVQVGTCLRWDAGREMILATWRGAPPAPFGSLPDDLPPLPWQRLPLIARDRQQFLWQQRQLPLDIMQGRYPFANMCLTRADIEWLLLTHQSASLAGIAAGPVVWADDLQRDRPGLDLRGADLRGVDLSGLPLTRAIGGLSGDAWKVATNQQRELAAVHLEGADLTRAHLEGAEMRDAHLEGARLHVAHLDSALLRGAHLEHAQMQKARLRHTFLSGATMQGADLTAAQLQQTDLILADLRQATLRRATLQDVQAQGTSFADADLREARIEHSFFYYAHLESALLANAVVVASDLRLGGVVSDRH